MPPNEKPAKPAVPDTKPFYETLAEARKALSTPPRPWHQKGAGVLAGLFWIVWLAIIFLGLLQVIEPDWQSGVIMALIFLLAVISSSLAAKER